MELEKGKHAYLTDVSGTDNPIEIVLIAVREKVGMISFHLANDDPKHEIIAGYHQKDGEIVLFNVKSIKFQYRSFIMCETYIESAEMIDRKIKDRMNLLTDMHSKWMSVIDRAKCRQIFIQKIDAPYGGGMVVVGAYDEKEANETALADADGKMEYLVRENDEGERYYTDEYLSADKWERVPSSWYMDDHPKILSVSFYIE